MIGKLCKEEIRAIRTKILTSLFGIVLISSIVILTSAKVQSRFWGFEQDSSNVFVDKYIDETLRNNFVSKLSSSTTGFLSNIGLLSNIPKNKPVGYFVTDRHYGIVTGADPLIRQKLKNEPTSDFPVFKSIAFNLYANELVSKSFTTRDGKYIFQNLEDSWQETSLHAYTHSIIARNIPSEMAPIFSMDSSHDSKMEEDFTFIGECFALLASDLYKMSNKYGIDSAWDYYQKESVQIYTAQDSKVKENEEYLSIFYQTPTKPLDYYTKCNAFTLFCLENYGKDFLCKSFNKIVLGNYNSIDTMFCDVKYSKLYSDFLSQYK